jgi:signal transduction histidine kinase
LLPFVALGGVVIALFVAVVRLGNPEFAVFGLGGIGLVALLVARHRQVLRAHTEVVERERAQERRLLDVERLDALGRTSRSIAHDFNGLLMGILGNADLVMEDIGSDPATARRNLGHIRAAARTASELTRQLMAFAHEGTVEMVDVDVAAIAQAEWPLLRSTLPRAITANLDAPASGVLAHTGAGFVPQILHNLVGNARDAMLTGGRLEVSVSQQGGWVVLRVTDTGHGMDEATQRRIFEPFFTTKGKRGTGLGLPTVYGIVRQSGGDISVSSRVGEGATFEVRLPAA